MPQRQLGFVTKLPCTAGIRKPNLAFSKEEVTR